MQNKQQTPEAKKATRILYIALAAILCITAIIIGIVSAANRETPQPDLDVNLDVSVSDESKPPEETPPTENKPPVLKAPTKGKLTHLHSMTEPFYSQTMNDWRVHKGIDVTTQRGAAVLAAADGTVKSIEKHPMMGNTVTLEHAGGMVTVYQNLGEIAAELSVGDSVKCGDVIASVGDTAILESAAEPHLHFEVMVGGKQVDPLLHIDEASQESSFTVNDEGYEG